LSTAIAVSDAGSTAPVPDYGSGPRPEWLGTDWSRHLRWLEIDGRPVNLLDMGSGPPLVFVHGHSACWAHWLEQIPVFARTNRVVALDLPGFGHSPLPADELSISGYARTIDQVCEALGIDAACLVGNSMGGFVAAELAINFPQRVERLVLVAAAGVSDRYIGLPAELMRHPGVVAASRVLFALGGVPDRLARAIAARPRGRRFALGWVCTHPEQLHSALVYEIERGAGRPGAALASLAIATYDFRDRVSEIACPTLIVWGDRDYLISHRSAHEYERLIEHTEMHVYPDTGHVPMIERPARFNADLRSFLAA